MEVLALLILIIVVIISCAGSLFKKQEKTYVYEEVLEAELPKKRHVHFADTKQERSYSKATGEIVGESIISIPQPRL